MRLVQCICNLRPELQDLIDGQWTFLKPLRQRLSFYALHHQVVDPVLMADVVEHADVGMVQAGDGFGFALESLSLRGIGGKLRQNLDRDCPFQPRVARTVHLTHPARAECRRDFIRPKLLTWSQSHRWPEL